MEYARDSGAASVLEVNAPLIEEQATWRGLIDRAGAERVAERAFTAAEVLAAVSTPLAEYLERHPSARGRIHVVPNGTNPGRFPSGLAPSCPGEPGSFTIGFLGHLKPWHGLPVLVEAFAIIHAAHSETRLLVVGDGPEHESMTQLLATRSVLGAAHFTGRVGMDEVPGLLASMDMAVAPYPPLDYFYFSPLKLFEYMAAGLPIVASRIGQLEELIEDGVTGLLCDPGDAAALASAIERLRASPELRTRLGRTARETALEKHTWEAVARRILALARLNPAAYAGAR
jgi:glycosyltransferase involved in cell wall biosynthesis